MATMSTSRTLAIGEVARRSGLPASTLRYYERIGLIAAPPRQAGQRRYPPEVLDTCALIQTARAAGFSLAEIRTLFRGFDVATPPPARWRALVDRKLPEIDARLRDLRRIRRRLERLAGCTCTDLAQCAHRR